LTPTAGAFSEAYTRFLTGDPAALIDLLDADVVYHLPGRHLGGGTLGGREELLGRLAAAGGWCDEVRVELLAVATAGVFVVTIERMHAGRGDRVLDQDVSVVWRFAGARCAEIWSAFADQRACDEFWAEFRPPRG
jgi:ketosteroid isomerase-like protein